MAKLIGTIGSFTGYGDNAIVQVKVYGRIKQVMVSGKSILFQQCKAGELVQFKGEWVSDRVRIHFKARGCEKIYSDKVLDVLGE
jgi:hypothetical protein